MLHVQAYPYLDEEDGTTIQRITEALNQVDTATSGLDYPVDYARLREVVEVPRGMPVPLEVTTPEPAPETLWDRLELIAAEPGLKDDTPQEG